MVFSTPIIPYSIVLTLKIHYISRSFGAALHGEAAGARAWRPLAAPALGVETPRAAGPAGLSVHVLSARTDTAAECVLQGETDRGFRGLA